MDAPQEAVCGRLIEARGVPHAVRFLSTSVQMLGCGRPALVMEMEEYDCK